MFSALITALRTLTIIPIPGSDAENHSDSLPFFSVAGIIIGAAQYITVYCCIQLLDEQYLLSALVCTVFSVFITGALHIDGLGDCADAFGGGKSREHILEILKDSRHGTFGVTAIIFDLMAKVLLISICLENGSLIYIALFPVFSRLIQACGCSFFPYARKNGGTAVSFTSGKNRMTVLIISLILSGIAIAATGELPVAIMIIVSFITGICYYCYSYKRIGGITGDCIGAGSELSEISFLMTGILCFHFFH